MSFTIGAFQIVRQESVCLKPEIHMFGLDFMLNMMTHRRFAITVEASRKVLHQILHDATSL